MFQLKVQLLDRCPECQGAAYLPCGGAVSSGGEVYTRHAACPTCEGSGVKPRWVDLAEFATLLQQATCSHPRITHTGGYHFQAGEVWDDIQEVCGDCGLNLDTAG